MKKLFVAILALLLCASALAEGDWASYTDDELTAMIDELTVLVNGARDELARRSNASESSGVVFDKDGHKLTVTNMRQGDSIFAKLSVSFDALYENNSDGQYTLVISDTFVNGWDTGSAGTIRTEPGHKLKDTITIKLDDTDVESIDDIQTIEFIFAFMDEHYKLTTFDPVVVYSK